MVRHGGPRPVKAVISQPARALGTEYQNLTGRPLLVIVCVTCDTGATAANSAAQCAVRVKASSPADVTVANVGVVGDGDRTSPTARIHTLVFGVPPGYYYNTYLALLGTGSVTLYSWTEVEL